jgi:hypothetical protein
MNPEQLKELNALWEQVRLSASLVARTGVEDELFLEKSVRSRSLIFLIGVSPFASSRPNFRLRLRERRSLRRFS